MIFQTHFESLLVFFFLMVSAPQMLATVDADLNVDDFLAIFFGFKHFSDVFLPLLGNSMPNLSHFN